MIPIKGFEEFYSITPDGRLFSHRKGKFIKPSVTIPYGHCQYFLGGKWYKAHRLVLETYKKPCPLKYKVKHIDGNRQNNHISNLECVTHSENILRGYREKPVPPQKHKMPLAKEKPVKAIGDKTIRFSSIQKLLDKLQINRRTFNRYLDTGKSLKGYRFELMPQ